VVQATGGLRKCYLKEESTDKAEECVVIKPKTNLTDFTEHGIAITYLQRENKTQLKTSTSGGFCAVYRSSFV
jgi:hypothetical protein